MNKYLLALLLVPTLVFGVTTNKVDNLWIPSSFRFTPGAIAGRVFTSDLNGFGSWAVPIAGGDVFQAGFNQFTGTNTFQNARLAIGTNAIDSTTWDLLWRGDASGTLALIDVNAAVPAQFRFVSGGSDIGDIGVLDGNTLFTQWHQAGGDFRFLDNGGQVELIVGSTTLTIGSGSASTIAINSSTATTPNGLNFNSGQFDMRTTRTNFMSDGLAIGAAATTLATHSFTMASNTTDIAIYNTEDQLVDFQRLTIGWSNTVASIFQESAGTAANSSLRFRSIPNSGGFSEFLMTRISPPFFSFTNTSTGTLGTLFKVSTPILASSGLQSHVGIEGRVTQTGTAGYNGLWINIAEVSTGTGTNLLLSVGKNDVPGFTVDNLWRTTIGTNGVAISAAVSTNYVFDPPSIAATAQFNTNVLLNGAAIAAPTGVGSSVNTAGIIITANAIAAGVVTISFHNYTALPIDPANQDVHIRSINP